MTELDILISELVFVSKGTSVQPIYSEYFYEISMSEE